MNDEERGAAIASEEIERLEGLLDGPLGAMAFPLLAEAHRRAGRPEEAERVAREGLRGAAPASAGHIALALALLDQKRAEEARAELEGLLGGDAEHGIARRALAGLGGDAEGLASEERPRGELASLDPYPESPPADVERRAPVEREPSPWPDRGPSPWPDRGPSPWPEREPSPWPERGPSPWPEREPGAWPERERTTWPELEASAAVEPPAAGPFGPPPPPAPAESLVFGGEVGDDELEGAFAEAESERDQMLGADDVAHAALAAVPDEETSPDDDETEGDESGFVATADPSSPFATETVAELLERQGHGEDAERLRARLPVQEVEPALELADEPRAARPDPPSPPDPDAGRALATQEPPPPRRTQATLERWLENLRRDRQ